MQTPATTAAFGSLVRRYVVRRTYFPAADTRRRSSSKKFSRMVTCGAFCSGLNSAIDAHKSPEGLQHFSNRPSSATSFPPRTWARHASDPDRFLHSFFGVGSTLRVCIDAPERHTRRKRPRAQLRLCLRRPVALLRLGLVLAFLLLFLL